jgi:hypothetical protein
MAQAFRTDRIKRHERRVNSVGGTLGVRWKRPANGRRVRWRVGRPAVGRERGVGDGPCETAFISYNFSYH